MDRRLVPFKLNFSTLPFKWHACTTPPSVSIWGVKNIDEAYLMIRRWDDWVAHKHKQAGWAVSSRKSSPWCHKGLKKELKEAIIIILIFQSSSTFPTVLKCSQWNNNNGPFNQVTTFLPCHFIQISYICVSSYYCSSRLLRLETQCPSGWICCILYCQHIRNLLIAFMAKR